MPYRVALLVNSLNALGLVHNLAHWAAEHPHIELVAFVVVPLRERGKSGGIYGAISRLLFDAMAAVESRLVLPKTCRAHLSPRWIGDCAPIHVNTTPAVSESGNAYALSPTDLSKIRDLKIDALVSCCPGGFAGDILQIARDGVIALEFGDGREGGGPPGFWEVLEGKPETEFVVRRLSNEPEGGEVLYKGSVATELFYSLNRQALCDRAYQYFMLAIERLASRPTQIEPAHRHEGNGHRCTPLLHHSMTYAFRTISRVAKKAWRHARGREWHWGVAYVFGDWQRTDLSSGRTLPAPPGTFIADPFAIAVDGKHYILAEEFSYAARKGIISVYSVDGQGGERIGVALEEPYHLSFPFVFGENGNIYMVPESEADQSIKLYQCDRFPDLWSLKAVLMTGVSAVDTILFQRGSRWWMLTTIKGKGRAFNCAELHAFYADDLLGEWTPHACNPVVMDATKGRNGGLLRDDEGTLYRVAQRRGFTNYADSFAIYRIDEISPETYRESLYREVEPTFFPGLSATHHMHSDAGLTVYDFSRDQKP